MSDVATKCGSPGASAALRATAPQRHGCLTVFPLLTGTPQPLPYRLLAEALSDGTVTIGEVGTGMVPSLLARNRGEVDVLILDGEQLIGARQNRITNRSMLLPAGLTTEIPVSCMEQGRWHFTTDTFRPAPKARQAPAGVRRHAKQAEARAAASTGCVDRRAAAMAQGAVWDQIADYGARLGGASDTGAMDDLYERRDVDIDAWLAAFPLEPGQVGLLAFLDGTPLGLDAVGCPDLFSRLHARFLGGYVVDALASGAVAGGGRGGESETPDEADALRFLAAVAATTRVPSETVGNGEYRVLAGGTIGGELVDAPTAAARLVHLSSFPADREPVETDLERRRVNASPLAPPSRRRAGKRRIE